MLKQDLNDFFIQNGIIPQSRNEVDLIYALINVMNKRPFAYAKAYHGNVGHVEHCLQHPHTQKFNSACCEIADILLLTIDNIGNMRYTFLQNKRDKKTQYTPSVPLQSARANNIQWDLLHYRCPLSNPLNTGLPYNCLSSAILDSAATYGIFLNESSSNDVDMSYNIARDLTCVNQNKKITNRCNWTYKISTNYNKINYVNGYCEIEGTSTLDDFEIATQNMFVGSPIDPNNPSQIELAKILLSYAYTCLINDKTKLEYFSPVIDKCAERYHINIEMGTDLPYNLIVIKAKNTYFATKSNTKNNIFHDCKLISTHEEIYSKIKDDDSIVIIDPLILDCELKLYLSITDNTNCYIAKQCDGGILLTNTCELKSKNNVKCEN